MVVYVTCSNPMVNAGFGGGGRKRENEISILILACGKECHLLDKCIADDRYPIILLLTLRTHYIPCSHSPYMYISYPMFPLTLHVHMISHNTLTHPAHTYYIPCSHSPYSIPSSPCNNGELYSYAAYMYI